MERLTYTREEYRLNEDGIREKWVYVPYFDEWMTEEDFYFQKYEIDESMKEAEEFDSFHSNDDVYPEDDDYDDEIYDDFDDEYDDETIDYGSMTREEALEDYNRTGVNHSNYDLNNWEEINRVLGFDFLDLSKRSK